jgi:hypothetical protein
VSNWWAAEAIGPTLTPVSGAQQTLSVSMKCGVPLYVAMFTFDTSDNMSAMSNVALRPATPCRATFVPIVRK